jgi:hypothetical protein
MCECNYCWHENEICVYKTIMYSNFSELKEWEFITDNEYMNHLKKLVDFFGKK